MKGIVHKQKSGAREGVQTPKEQGRLHAVKARLRVAGISAGGYAAKNIIDTGKKFGTKAAEDESEENGNASQAFKRQIQQTAGIRLRNYVGGIRTKDGFAGNVKAEKAESAKEAVTGAAERGTARQSGYAAGKNETQTAQGRRGAEQTYQKYVTDTWNAYRTGRRSDSGTRVGEKRARELPENREVLLRYCNVCSGPARENRYGVKSKEAHVKRGVEEEDAPEPRVCSQEERERIRQKKQGADRGEKTGTDGGNADKGKKAGRSGTKTDGIRDKEKKKRQRDWAKQQMIGNYVLQEMIHEEGRRDSGAHLRLIAQIAGYDAGKLGGWIAKKIGKAVGTVFAALFPVILSVCLVVAPIAGIFFYLNSPGAYSGGIYELDENVKENPKYLKNVVREMCRDFSGDIEFFLDLNGLNEVCYEYGSYPDGNGITAAYLAEVCAADGYETLAETDAEGYPPWLFVDTEQEKKLLKHIFDQFNSTKTEEIEAKVTDEKGKEEIVKASRMTVFCLTAEQWKQEHGAELTADAAEVFEELLAGIDETGSGGNDSFVAGDAVPIENLVIPPGVDENLIYMAGFLRAEAGNQPEIGKTAVAYVILNRAGGATGNIKGVLTAPYQFSCFIPYHTVEQYLTAYAAMTQEQREADSCYRAAAAAYYGTSANPIGGMKYYCNPKYCTAGEAGQWARIRARNSDDEIVIIGDHVFCKNGW